MGRGSIQVPALRTLYACQEADVVPRRAHQAFGDFTSADQSFDVRGGFALPSRRCRSQTPQPRG